MKLNRLYLAVFAILLVACSTTEEQSEPTTFQNPVIPGFYPDPSMCRVGDDYYLVNSTFEWFPGIPIFHSKDLVNWKQIGHVLNRKSQLNMVDNKFSSGVWAPTIRYHEGTFYVTATCQRCGKNMYVTSDKPEGPYSDPIYIDAPPGIDPSFLFDDDGRVWFSANKKSKPELYPGHRMIYVQEINIETGELLGEQYDLTTGWADSARATEAPHIYKVNGKYHLIVAEGGTWTDHAVTMFVSDSATGPYESYEHNPVLTHRNFKDNPITSTGHADIVQTQNGEWWAVALAVRPVENEAYYLGRETFLIPVKFENDRFYFAPDSGMVKLEDVRPDLPWTPIENNYSDDFNDTTLNFMWNFLRTPQYKWYSLTEIPGKLKINTRPEKVTEWTNPSLIARRFQHHKFTVSTKVDFEPQAANEEAGLVAMQNDRYNYRLVIQGEANDLKLVLYKVYNKSRKKFTEQIIAAEPIKSGELVLSMKVEGMNVEFFYGTAKESLKNIGGVQDARPFTSNAAGGFIGAYVGMYTSSNGTESSNSAIFDWFEYTPN